VCVCLCGYNYVCDHYTLHMYLHYCLSSHLHTIVSPRVYTHTLTIFLPHTCTLAPTLLPPHTHSTWAGPAWSAAQTLLSVLLSIQSLMNEKPYHNEPGFEQVCNTASRNCFIYQSFHPTIYPLPASLSMCLSIISLCLSHFVCFSGVRLTEWVCLEVCVCVCVLRTVQIACLLVTSCPTWKQCT